MYSNRQRNSIDFTLGVLIIHPQALTAFHPNKADSYRPICLLLRKSFEKMLKTRSNWIEYYNRSINTQLQIVVIILFSPANMAHQLTKNLSKTSQ